MKKKLIAISIVSMFLLTGLAALSVAGTKVTTTNLQTATIEGIAKNKYGRPCRYANIEIRIGDDPETSEYVKTVPVENDGTYSIELDADEQGTTYQVRAYTVSITCEGDESEWVEVTVFPGQTYELPDLILPHTPKSKQVIHPLFLRFLENHPRIFPILQHLLGV